MNATIQIGHRKIQRIQKALYINIPKIWAMHNNATRGDVVDISINPDGSLRIAPATAAKHVAGTANTPEVEVAA